MRKQKTALPGADETPTSGADEEVEEEEDEDEKEVQQQIAKKLKPYASLSRFTPDKNSILLIQGELCLLFSSFFCVFPLLFTC